MRSAWCEPVSDTWGGLLHHSTNAEVGLQVGNDISFTEEHRSSSPAAEFDIWNCPVLHRAFNRLYGFEAQERTDFVFLEELIFQPRV